MLCDRRYQPPPPPPENFVEEGAASVYSTDSAEESERERKRKTSLGKRERKRLEAMLRSLTSVREKIARPMAFALERAEAADEVRRLWDIPTCLRANVRNEQVAELIVQSLLIDSTPVPRKIARLHLVSDILHNSASTIHHAWKYRLAFESRLPRVFVHLNAIYRSFPGRMQAENFRVLVTDVTNAWENWLVFTPSSLESMQRLLVEGEKQETETPVVVEEEEVMEDEGSEKPSGFRAVGSGTFVPVVKTDDVDGLPIDVDVDGVLMTTTTEQTGGEDVDGQLMGDDVDGRPLTEDVDIDGTPIEVDGEPMETSDVDGEPIGKEDDLFT
jgi:U2-associated protein SR140